MCIRDSGEPRLCLRRIANGECEAQRPASVNNDGDSPRNSALRRRPEHKSPEDPLQAHPSQQCPKRCAERPLA
eukprot:9801852-Alexandrium_andersonii.AAC.1